VAIHEHKTFSDKGGLLAALHFLADPEENQEKDWVNHDLEVWQFLSLFFLSGTQSF